MDPENSILGSKILKPGPPLVPPKPSKSRSQQAIPSVHVNSRLLKSNQSFETDDSTFSTCQETLVETETAAVDSGSGDNLPFPILILESLLDRLEIIEKKEDDEINIDEFGDCRNMSPSQSSRPEGEELMPPPPPILVTPTLLKEEIAPIAPPIQSDVVNVDKGESNDTNVSEVIDAINQQPDGPGPTDKMPVDLLVSQCPFFHLHHKNPCDFVQEGECLDKKSRNFLRIDDLSSKIDQRIKFIIENLRDCGGIWPLLFIEKLNEIISGADISQVQMCFQEDFSLILELIGLYRDERRCNVIFRFWCTFYNFMCRNIIPHEMLAISTDLIGMLKRDFILASEGKCRCSKHSRMKDREHMELTPKMRMDILSILLIPLYTAKAFAPQLLSFDNSEEKKFIGQILKMICTGHLDRESSPHPGISTIVDDAFAEMGTNIEAHLLLAMNLQYPSKGSNPIVQVCSELSRTLDISLFRSKILTIFLQEVGILKQGHLEGIRSLFSVPLGVQILGVNGPMKLLIDFLSCGGSFNLFDSVMDLKLISGVACNIEEIVCQPEISDCRTDEIKINARDLQKLVQQKIPLEIVNEEEFQQDYKSFLGQKSDLSDDEKSSNSKEHVNPSGKKGLMKRNIMPRIRFRPLDLLMRLIGCKKPCHSVAPASISDISYLVWGSNNNKS